MEVKNEKFWMIISLEFVINKMLNKLFYKTTKKLFEEQMSPN